VVFIKRLKEHVVSVILLEFLAVTEKVHGSESFSLQCGTWAVKNYNSLLLFVVYILKRQA